MNDSSSEKTNNPTRPRAGGLGAGKENVMSDREVPFEEDAVCGQCGGKGAFDFMGDYLCEECAKKSMDAEDEEK